MGNLDRTPMQEVPGASGPGLVLRSVFAELAKEYPSGALYLSPRLQSAKVCAVTGQPAGPDCPSTEEWFEPGSVPEGHCRLHGVEGARRGGLHALQERAGVPRITLPTPGLQMAMDPRIPDTLEAFQFEAGFNGRFTKTEWLVDSKSQGCASGLKCLWPLAKGHHLVRLKVWQEGIDIPLDSGEVGFAVK